MHSNRILIVLTLASVSAGISPTGPGVPKVIHGFARDGQNLGVVPGTSIELGKLVDGSFARLGVYTITNVDGHYLIDGVPRHTNAIRASFVGYETRTQIVLDTKLDTLRIDWVMTQVSGEELERLCRSGCHFAKPMQLW